MTNELLNESHVTQFSQLPVTYHCVNRFKFSGRACLTFCSSPPWSTMPSSSLANWDGGAAWNPAQSSKSDVRTVEFPTETNNHHRTAAYLDASWTTTEDHTAVWWAGDSREGGNQDDSSMARVVFLFFLLALSCLGLCGIMGIARRVLTRFHPFRLPQCQQYPILSPMKL